MPVARVDHAGDFTAQMNSGGAVRRVGLYIAPGQVAAMQQFIPNENLPASSIL